eukprot:1862849-Lingulodinium_polyedra.AAC.1
MPDLDGEWTQVGNAAKVVLDESVSAVPAAKGTVEVLDVSPFWIVDYGAGRDLISESRAWESDGE